MYKRKLPESVDDISSPDKNGFGVEFPVSCGLIGKSDYVSESFWIIWEHAFVEKVLGKVDG